MEEIVVGAMIRDNLVLNMVELIHPFQAISTWQSGISKKSAEIKVNDKDFK